VSSNLTWFPARAKLVDAIAAATRAAVRDLFREYPADHFYYCSLITTGEALSPNLVAWSWEALHRQCKGDPIARSDLKWSYADSPFFCYGEQHFGDVRRLFLFMGVPDHNDPDAWHAAYDFKLSAMEAAMARLDGSGLFGTGARRAEIVINVECMPPDHTNVERALRLNPPEALSDWLNEAAEPE
jgi:hypothetical protein